MLNVVVKVVKKVAKFLFVNFHKTFLLHNNMLFVQYDEDLQELYIIQVKHFDDNVIFQVDNVQRIVQVRNMLFL